MSLFRILVPLKLKFSIFVHFSYLKLFKVTSLGKPVRVNIVFEILAFGEVDEANMVRTKWKHMLEI